MFDHHRLHPQSPNPADAESSGLSREPLRLLGLLREKRLYIEAREVIFELEKWAVEHEQIWFELEEEKARIYSETGDWWRAILSLTHLIQNPNSPTQKVEAARRARIEAAYEAGDSSLAARDLEKITDRSLKLQLLNVKILLRLGQLEEAVSAWSEISTPSSVVGLADWMRTRMEIERASGEAHPDSARALVAIAQASDDASTQGLAWLNYLAGMQWEPLRIRNEAGMAQILSASPRIGRLLDEISSPGLDLFRSTTSRLLIEIFNSASAIESIDAHGPVRFVNFSLSGFSFDCQNKQFSIGLAEEETGSTVQLPY